jgi:membrane protein DedA with SNARE-associated domain
MDSRRLVRYSVLAYLGARFGDQAADVFKDHYLALGLILVAVVILLVLWRHFRGREKAANSGK